MGFTIRRYFRTVGAGNSLTFFGWATVAGGLVDQVNAKLGTTSIADEAVSIPGGSRFSTVGGVAAKIKGGAMEYINRGISGWSTADILADAPNVVAIKPDAVILDIGINDPPLGISAATSRTNIDGALDAYIAGGISQVLMVSLLVNGELWSHVGPAFSGNGFDSANDALIVQAQASCAARGITFAPLRPAALSYIIANGPPEPGASFGTLVDSTLKHPIVPAGQLWMCNQVMPFVTVVP